MEVRILPLLHFSKLGTSQKIMENNNEEILISWNAPEFTYYEKSSGWFLGLTIISGVFFLISVLTKNYFFAFLILIAFFLIYVHAIKKPRKVKIEISEKGIDIAEQFLPYKEIVSFWIFEEPELKMLSLESKKFFRPRPFIPLAGQAPENIRAVLKKFIPEKKQEESLIDILARRIRF